jgi:alpha-glucosidase (family GH31 glycosyl hydrolase)
LNRGGQRYRLTNIDAMGYSARTSDPLFKHIPFYIACRPDAGLAFGLFYDTLSDCVFDFGKEVDNYHGPYRSFTADHGDLDYYFIAGPRVDQWRPASPGWRDGLPWMYPKATSFVRDLIKLRYRLIPYLYYLLWRYHHDYEPVVRPTLFDFPNDMHCWREGDEMMVGRSLLAAPVVEPGHVHREVYLPFGAHWYDFWSGEVFKGGQTITRPAP